MSLRQNTGSRWWGAVPWLLLFGLLVAVGVAFGVRTKGSSGARIDSAPSPVPGALPEKAKYELGVLYEQAVPKRVLFELIKDEALRACWLDPPAGVKQGADECRHRVETNHARCERSGAPELPEVIAQKELIQELIYQYRHCGNPERYHRRNEARHAALRASGIR